MNKIWGIIICIVFAPCVYGNVFEHPKSLEYISKQIPELKSISCTFCQEKVIPSSMIVLKSSGDFKFEKDKGVTFYTTYPVKSTVSYTSREYKHINNVISALSNKSYSRLEKDFKFYYEEAENWSLGLIPRNNSPVFNYLKSIELEGNENMITKMVILAADSTRTTIWFK